MAVRPSDHRVVRMPDPTRHQHVGHPRHQLVRGGAVPHAVRADALAATGLHLGDDTVQDPLRVVAIGVRR